MFKWKPVGSQCIETLVVAYVLCNKICWFIWFTISRRQLLKMYFLTYLQCFPLILQAHLSFDSQHPVNSKHCEPYSPQNWSWSDRQRPNPIRKLHTPHSHCGCCHPQRWPQKDRKYKLAFSKRKTCYSSMSSWTPPCSLLGSPPLANRIFNV